MNMTYDIMEGEDGHHDYGQPLPASIRPLCVVNNLYIQLLSCQILCNILIQLTLSKNSGAPAEDPFP